MEQATSKKQEVINNMNIPHDVATIILSKLPVKSLYRFGLAQTSWSNLLENPKFVSVYLQNWFSDDDGGSSVLLWQQVSEGLPELHLISGERFEKKVELDWPPPCLEEDVKFITILDYCDNGTIGLIKGTYGDKNDVVLWNPITKEYRVIPSGLSQVQGIIFSFMVHAPGFWYDRANDDYKLLQHAACFGGDPKVTEYFWQIYSLKRNSWKRLDLDTICASQICKPMGSMVNLNGSLHWWGTKHHDIGTREDLLISFDKSNEMFRTTPLDCAINAYNVNRHLTEFNGSIAVMSYYFKNNVLDISILGEIGVKESWTKILTIKPLPYFELPIFVGDKGIIFFIKEDGELGCYDFRTQMCKEIDVKGVYDNSKIVIYSDSFVPFGGIKY